MIIYKSFEDFLADKFGRSEGASVLDDDWPDAFSDWLANLPIDQVIKWADEYANIKALK